MNLYNIYGHYSLQLSHNSHRLRWSRYIKIARWPKFVVLRSQVWYTFGLRPVLEWSVGDAPCWKWWAARNFDPSVKFRGAILSINWVIVNNFNCLNFTLITGFITLQLMCYTTPWVIKQDTKLLPKTSPNVNRFSKFFRWQSHWYVSNKFYLNIPKNVATLPICAGKVWTVVRHSWRS